MCLIFYCRILLVPVTLFRLVHIVLKVTVRVVGRAVFARVDMIVRIAILVGRQSWHAGHIMLLMILDGTKYAGHVKEVAKMQRQNLQENR